MPGLAWQPQVPADGGGDVNADVGNPQRVVRGALLDSYVSCPAARSQQGNRGRLKL